MLAEDVRILQVTGISRSGLEEKSVLVQEVRSRSGGAWMQGGDCMKYGNDGGDRLGRVEWSFGKSLIGRYSV